MFWKFFYGGMIHPKSTLKKGGWVCQNDTLMCQNDTLQIPFRKPLNPAKTIQNDWKMVIFTSICRTRQNALYSIQGYMSFSVFMRFNGQKCRLWAHLNAIRRAHRFRCSFSPLPSCMAWRAHRPMFSRLWFRNGYPDEYTWQKFSCIFSSGFPVSFWLLRQMDI